MTLVAIYLFIIGLFFGSFYNVVGMRLCKNESIIKPRSHCINCNHSLSWYELIPIFSYIFLKGRCKNCHLRISIQYPLVELITGLLFASSFIIFGFHYNTIISIIISSIVVIIFITDAIYMVILDEVLMVGLILLLIVYLIFEGPILMLKHLAGGLLILLLFLIIKILGDKAFKQESLGWGDVKLSLVAGTVLGPYLGIVFIVLASFLAFPYAIYISIRHHEAMLPFGPFLATSMLIIFWNSDLIISLLQKLIGG